MIHPSEAISAYLDGELSPAETRSLEGHLGGCGRCAAELEDMHRVRAAVRSLPLLEMPEDLLPDEMAELVPLHRNRGLLVGVAAAVFAIVVAIAALVTTPPATVSADDLSSRFGARASLDPAFGPAKVVLPQLEADR